jgi:hypothetical protein
MVQPLRVLIVTCVYTTVRRSPSSATGCRNMSEASAAAADETAYGTKWWRRRAWAKRWLGETERFAWWELVDRWRYGPVTR